jgi:hypothetical protein
MEVNRMGLNPSTTASLLAGAALLVTGCGGIISPGASNSQGDVPATSPGAGGALGGSPIGNTSLPSSGATGGTIATGSTTPLAADGSPLPFEDCPTAAFMASHPLCGTTSAGTAIAKGVACTAADPQLCFKPCGNIGVGLKSETCSAGYYVEASYCVYDPACDYSCYRLPAEADPACPTPEATVPRRGQPCTLPACVVCGGTASEQTTGFLEPSGTMRVGYCSCRQPVITGMGYVITSPIWACGVGGAHTWPCPGEPGC